jgi:hypothetical protein
MEDNSDIEIENIERRIGILRKRYDNVDKVVDRWMRIRMKRRVRQFTGIKIR